ncbi:MAG: segregation/condensation protein A, partial [Eubacteriales bacterium]
EKIEKENPVHHLSPEEIPVEKMIANIVKRIIINPKGISFKQIISYGSRMEIVVAFLSILELLKDGKIRAEQLTNQNDIFLVPTDKLWEFEEEE